MNMNSTSSKSNRRSSLIRLALTALTITVAALSYMILKHLDLAKNNKTTATAMARPLSCGPSTATTEDHSAAVKKWLISDNQLPTESQAAFLSVIGALPPKAKEALESEAVRIAINPADQSLHCHSQTDRYVDSATRQTACLRHTKDYGSILVIHLGKKLNQDGVMVSESLEEFTRNKLLSMLLWVVIEDIWNPRDDFKIYKKAEASSSNALGIVKKQLADSLILSPEEETNYLRDFGASGRQNPAFFSRSVVLLGSNIYCSGASFQNLIRLQPKAVNGYLGSFGCALGKPWFMTEDAFSSFCPSINIH
jgi:hypothetical protein